MTSSHWRLWLFERYQLPADILHFRYRLWERATRWAGGRWPRKAVSRKDVMEKEYFIRIGFIIKGQIKRPKCCFRSGKQPVKTLLKFGKKSIGHQARIALLAFFGHQLQGVNAYIQFISNQ